MKRYLFGVVLLAGLSACSEEPVGEHSVPVPIEITAALPGDGTGSASPASKAVADPAQSLTLYFVRADQDASGTYGDYAAWAIPATRAAGTGAQALTFTTPQYYLANRKASKLTGWYPQPGRYNDGVAAWALDGSQDVMTAPAQSGSLTSAKMSFAFSHRLTQLQFYPYAEDDKARAAWGYITEISVSAQPTGCSYDLATNDDDGAVVFGNTLDHYLVKGFTSFQLPVGIDNAKRVGDPMMIAPHSELYSVRIMVKSSTKGSAYMLAPSRTYAAGSVIRMKLKFTRLTYHVEPEISIEDWVSSDSSTEVKTDPVPEPGVDIGDWTNGSETELN